MSQQGKKYMNPYLAGVSLGLLLLAIFYIAGHGLGASGAVKQFTVAAVDEVAPAHTADNSFYAPYAGEDYSMWDNWIVFMFMGMVIGGFISGAVSDRLGFKIEKGPRIGNATRLLFALIGGVLFGIGSQLAKGCTSGAALSGMAALSASGFIAMLAIFGVGFIVSIFFKRLWK
ncbi:putative inner membrane protein [Salinivirga cyanobacteriivorans]|uniref:Putative inner membrane protein n=1 Tax=Salinivirga cyanobacteriivorans TaxID=1307839 RepID=A0A0S2I1N3_9BACT|nr:YeeE/YedE thiosulfate transporter family protein [Salinivirga cyanobacteriivorans]ALO16085.1 putative inner membrane protein [Salinivirga cyanobacteriivorans]